MIDVIYVIITLIAFIIIKIVLIPIFRQSILNYMIKWYLIFTNCALRIKYKLSL